MNPEQKSKPSNYDLLCDTWRAQFLTWDHTAQMQNLRLPGLYDDRIALTYFHVPYWIDRATGVITNLNAPQSEIPFSVQMALYHLLWYARENPKNSGQWIPFREVKGASQFDAAFQRSVTHPFAAAFSGNAALLREVGAALGFPALSRADAGFYVEAFSCVPMQFLFWDADEEFEARCNILFDRNITDFTHAETVVTMAGDGVRTFLAAAGLPSDRF